MSLNAPEYIVVPFRPTLDKDSKYSEIANQVHALLSSYVNKGWIYVGIEKIEAVIGPGIGTENQTSVQVMIFKK